MVAGGHTSATAVSATTVTFTALAGILTAARIFTRKAIVRTAGVDDVLVLIGMVLSTLLTIAICEQVKYGMGQHESALTPHDTIMSLRWFWASVWIYYLALWAVKMSILFQYLRILPEDGPYRKACYSLMVVVSVWTLWAFFSAVFACFPVNAFWELNIQGYCLDRLAVWFSNAAVNIVTDICTAVLPLPVLGSLRIPKRQKYILMGVFGLGGVTCLISILRLQSLYVVSKSTDISWDNPLAATWSSLEVNVGIICSCLPTLKGVFSRFFPGSTMSDSYLRSNSRHRIGSVAFEPCHDRSTFKFWGYRLNDVEKPDQQVLIENLESGRSPSNGSIGNMNMNPTAPLPAVTSDEMAHKTTNEEISRFAATQRMEWDKDFAIFPNKSRTEK